LIRAVEGARDAIFVAREEDASRPIIYTNASFSRITGYDEGEALGEPMWLLTGPQTDSEGLEQVRRAVGAGEAVVEGAVLHRKDGTPFVAEWSFAPVRDASGRVTHWVSVLGDVTEQRRLRQDVVDVSEEERLRIGRALHDIMAPNLTAATFILERVVEGRSDGEPAGDDLKQVLAILRSAAGRVRDLSHLLSPVEIESHGLAEALRRLASRIASVAAVDCQAEVAAEPDAEIERVDDRALVHLYRIAEEAAHNAAHHADPSQITIRFEEKTDDRYVLEVEDDGVGLTADLEAGGGPGGGTGLDLMRYRAECVGGDFHVGRREGGGTVVRCAVPAAALEATPDA
jgi:PAS domain S-box-containing protein